MKQAKKVGILLLVSFLVCLFFGTTMNVLAYADSNDTNLMLSTTSVDGVSKTKVSNIKGFVSKMEKVRKSKKAMALEIFDKLNYEDKDIDRLSNQDLEYALTVNTIEVHKSIVEVDSVTGESFIRDSVPEEIKAINNNASLYSVNGNTITSTPGGTDVVTATNNDWMEIITTIYQDPNFNITEKVEEERIDKDGNPYMATVDVVRKYGYKCDFVFRWLSNPLWRSVEELGIAWSNDGVLISGGDSGYYGNYGTVTYNYSYPYAGGTQIDSGTDTEYLDYKINSIYGRALEWNLPTNLTEILFSGFTYELGVILVAEKDFNLLASYAHRKFGTGSLGISIGPASISFSATQKNVFTTGAYYIDVPPLP